MGWSCGFPPDCPCPTEHRRCRGLRECWFAWLLVDWHAVKLTCKNLHKQLSKVHFERGFGKADQEVPLQFYWTSFQVWAAAPGEAQRGLLLSPDHSPHKDLETEPSCWADSHLIGIAVEQIIGYSDVGLCPTLLLNNFFNISTWAQDTS